MDYPLNTLGLAHKFIAENVREGDFCIDATAGNGHDTEFLCRLVGETGRVLAMDIQKQAVENTKKRMEECGFADRCEVVLASHADMGKYAKKESASAVMFNLGWLPGGDHKIFSRADTTIDAVNAALEILRPGGVMSVCIYYGRDCGYEERDRLLEYFPTIDNRKYTVVVSNFVNRTGDIPIPVFIYKQ